MSNKENMQHGNRRLWISILQLASGTALSQLIVLLTTPVLTRYYSPHDFGVAGFFLSFLMFLGPLSTLNYYQAIILPKSDGDSLHLGRLCLMITLGSFPLFLALFYLLRPALITFFKMPELAPIFWLFPMAILIRSSYLTLAAYMSRYRAFTVQSKARICQTLSERSLSLAIGFAGHATSLMLVFARFISMAFETGLLLLAFLRRPKDSAAEEVVAETSTRALAYQYRDFPLYSSWAMLLGNGSTQLPMLLLPVLFSPSVAGFYALGNRLFQLPMQILGESIRNAYYKEVSDRVNNGLDNNEGFQRLRNHLVAAGMFPFCFLLFFGNFLFKLIFGAQWAQAGTYAGIVGFFLFFQFISTPISCIFNAYKKQSYLVIISSLLFLNNLVSLLLGAYLGSPTIGFVLLTVNGVFIYMLMTFFAEKVLNASHILQFITYGKYLAFNAPFIVVFYLIKAWTDNTVIILSFCVLCSIVYYSLLFRRSVISLVYSNNLSKA